MTGALAARKSRVGFCCCASSRCSGGPAHDTAAVSRPTACARRRHSDLANFLLKLGRVGVAHFPRVQQQAGPREHITGELLALAALEDVAVFIADLAACGIEVRQLCRRALRRAKPRETTQPVKQPTPRLEARRRNVHASERRDVCQLHRDNVFFDIDADDVELRGCLVFKLALLAKEPARAGNAVGDLEGEVALVVTEPQRKISGWQVSNREKTLLEFDLRTVVGDKHSRAHLQQADSQRAGVASTCGNPYRLSRASMNHSQPRALELVQFPHALAAVGATGANAAQAGERAQRHATLVVGLEGDGLRAGKLADG